MVSFWYAHTHFILSLLVTDYWRFCLLQAGEEWWQSAEDGSREFLPQSQHREACRWVERKHKHMHTQKEREAVCCNNPCYNLFGSSWTV